MNILKKYKNNKTYNMVKFTSILLVTLLCFATTTDGVNIISNSFVLKKADVELKSIENDISMMEKTLKDNPKLSIEELFVDHKETIKRKNELKEYIKDKEKELNKSENKLNLFTALIISIIIIFFWSNYMSKKTKVKKEDYIELLKEDNSFEKEAIEYLNIDSIENLLSDINYLKEFQKVVKEKDWLLKRIKEKNIFHSLLNNKSLHEYLSLFEKDYINDYFKEEIDKLKEDLESINKNSKEDILNEKESFRVIKI